MKILLVTPSNILYMPYLNNYISILESEGISYSIINWDRLNIETSSKNITYRDRKIGPRRNYFDYYKYSRFIRKRLKNEECDKIIVFGLQLSYFLRKLLSKKFFNKSIIDIRDHNKILDFFDFTELLKSAYIVVVSSKAYKDWLPRGIEYILNHNTNIADFDLVKFVSRKNTTEKSKYSISFIGAIRDSNVNLQLINSLKRSENLIVNYHGDGIGKDVLEDFVQKSNITNVNFSGRYNYDQEEQLYLDSDIINVLRLDSDVNNTTAIPNRLYNGLLYGRPFLALSGTYLAEIISQFSLGLVVDNLDNIENEVMIYLDNFDKNKFNQNSECLLKLIIDDNLYFESKVKEFIGIRKMNFKI